MKSLSQRISRTGVACLALGFLALALVLVIAPTANACFKCQFEYFNSYPWEGYVCESVGPFEAGYTGCLQDAYGWCHLYGDPCQGGAPGCFLAGTIISTPDGDRAIESLEEGDAIWCVGDDGERIRGEVVATIKHVSNGYYRLNGSTSVTGEHRFLTTGMGQTIAAGVPAKDYERNALGQWIPLADISIGQQLLTIDGSHQTVKTVEFVDKGVRVFNLEVTPHHNYFANGILVHNKKHNIQG